VSGNTGLQSFSITTGNLTLEYQGVVRARPSVSGNGIVDAATGQQRANGYAPGSYISLFGNALSDILKVASTPYLPVSLAGVSVSFDVQDKLSVPGRIHFVSPGQINVQIPWECRGQTEVSMKIAMGDTIYSDVFNIRIADTAPGAFEYRESNNQLSAAALDAGFNVIGENNPARRGAAVQLYYNGLGDVTDRPLSGEPALGNPLSSTVNTPGVSIGGRDAQVLFSGLAPGLVGVYQVNVIVPQDAPNGRQPVRLTINGINARDTFISVQ
jgi:uncharacterized protein (TIGR03437 family)